MDKARDDGERQAMLDALSFGTQGQFSLEAARRVGDGFPDKALAASPSPSDSQIQESSQSPTKLDLIRRMFSSVRTNRDETLLLQRRIYGGDEGEEIKDLFLKLDARREQRGMATHENTTLSKAYYPHMNWRNLIAKALAAGMAKMSLDQVAALQELPLNQVVKSVLKDEVGNQAFQREYEVATDPYTYSDRLRDWYPLIEQHVGGKDKEFTLLDVGCCPLADGSPTDEDLARHFPNANVLAGDLPGAFLLEGYTPKGDGSFMQPPNPTNTHVRYLVYDALDEEPPPEIQGESIKVGVCRNVIDHLGDEARAKLVSNMRKAVGPGALLLIGSTQKGMFVQAIVGEKS